MSGGMEDMPAIGTSIVEKPIRMAPVEAEKHRRDDATFRKPQQELNDRYQELVKQYPDQWIGLHQRLGIVHSDTRAGATSTATGAQHPKGADSNFALGEQPADSDPVGHMVVTGFFDESGRPAIEVQVKINDLGLGRVVRFIIDTGADQTLIGYEDATDLGVEFEQYDQDSSVESIGVGGRLRTYPEEGRLFFRDADYNLQPFSLTLAVAEKSPAGTATTCCSKHPNRRKDP